MDKEEHNDTTDFELNENENNCNNSIKCKTETDNLVQATSINNVLEVEEDVDYIFEKIVGGGDARDIGQWIVLLVLCPVVVCANFPLFMHVFVCFEPRHRCYIPNCDTLSPPSMDANWMVFAIPTYDPNNEEQSCQTEMLKEDELFDSCRRYSAMDETTCDANWFNQSRIEKCETFVYDTSVVTENFTTKFNLVCELKYKQTIMGVMLLLGLTIGSEIGGRLGDKYGRKRAMFIATIVITPTVMFAGYAKDFWTYAILKLINTAALPCVWFPSHAFVTEIFSKEHRQKGVLIQEVSVVTAEVGIVMVFYLTRHWTYFHLWAGGICCLAFPAFLVLPESPRWLSVNSKRELAEQELMKIARWNRRELSQDEKHKIASILQKVERNANSNQKKNPGLKDMLNSNNLRKTIIMALNWIIACVTCFTLALNVTRLSGNVFLNSALLVIIGTLPGTMLAGITLKLFSRRLNLFAYQFLAGLFCVIVAFLPKYSNLPMIIFYLLAVCCNRTSLTITYLITAELYPTNLRSQAIGSCSTVARIFSISVAFIPDLACTWKPLPMLVLGVPAICIAFLAYFLPETKFINLPETMSDAEDPKHVKT